MSIKRIYRTKKIKFIVEHHFNKNGGDTTESLLKKLMFDKADEIISKNSAYTIYNKETDNYNRVDSV